MTAGQKAIPLRALVQALFFVVVAPFLPLLISHQWVWYEAWVYGAIAVLGFGISRLLASRRHPDLLAERARLMRHEDAKPWDMVLARLVGLGGIAVPLVAGLDALFKWSPRFSVAVRGLSLIAFLAGYALSSYALIENRFFSGVVRIQQERGHHVVSSGPYRWMRHPGYAGAMLAYFATPFFLDSRWACVPALLLAVVLVVRTRFEDTTLQDELPGYRDYARQVRYRLVPGIW
jgi:protein-S-isoprenylcysteine O-methyltransferase Ste14